MTEGAHSVQSTTRAEMAQPPSESSWPCRVARENAETGQYELVDGTCRLMLSNHTVSLAQKPPPPSDACINLLHYPLSAVLFGSANDKIMIVPANRGPAWAIEMEVQAGGEALGILRSLGCKVAGPAGHTPSPISEPELESILNAPGFSSFLDSVEENLIRLRTRGVTGDGELIGIL